MQIKSRKSRLKETSFSQFNLRDAYITDQSEYLATLRDESLFSNYGILVTIKVPVNEDNELNENNVDEYSNFVDVDWIETTETVIPKFSQYRQNISEAGMSADGTDGLYPLEVILPSKLHCPRNTRIIFNEYSNIDEKLAREWVVLGTVQKQLSNGKTYTRIANCVPARVQTLDSAVITNDNEIFFDYTIDSNKVYNNKLRAQGNIWFVKNKIDPLFIRKGYSVDIIYEDSIETEDLTNNYTNTIDEDLFSLMYFDNRVKNIISLKNTYNVGDIIKLFNKDNKPLSILTNIDTNESLELSIVVTNTENGRIKSFEYLPNTGYIENNVDFESQILKDINDNLEINFVPLVFNDQLYQETINSVDENRVNLKYINPVALDAVFKTKAIVTNVLLK